jgi:methyl-accepting chemotaxis protein
MQAANRQLDQDKRLGEKLAAFLFEEGVDLAASRSAWKRVEVMLPQLLDNFYDEVAQTPELRDKLGPNQKNQSKLKAAQISHWDYILNHAPDIEFEGHALHIGEAHARVGLDIKWYLASYGRLIRDLVPAVVGGVGLGSKKNVTALQAMISHFFVDMILSVDAFNGGVRRMREERQQEEADLKNLKNLAGTVIDINNVTMDLALLSRNSRKATDSGQAISAAVAQLVASTEQISSNSESSADFANQTRHTVSQGLEVMQTVGGTMQNIADSSVQTEQSLRQLQTASEQIGGFLSVIETISNQTNLLALNATIEAARAGAAGKGFAVVAAEVKGLATQAAKATEDIAHRIHQLSEGMTTIQSAIEGSQAAVRDGQEQIAGASDLMQQIGGQVSEVSDSMREVATILHQQTKASQEIARSVAGVAGLSSENEEALSEMVNTIQESNDRFSHNASAWFVASSHRSMCEMAKIDHVLFKKRVVDTIMGRGQWESHSVPDHHTCRLGKWYDAIDNPQIRAHPIFEGLVEPHKRVHDAARQALSYHAANDVENTFLALRALDEASAEVISRLEALGRALEADLKHSDQRQHVRTVSDEVAICVFKDGQLSLPVTDRSKSGLGVLNLPQARVGSTLSVKLGNEHHIGEVMWVEGNRGGIRYLATDS